MDDAPANIIMTAKEAVRYSIFTIDEEQEDTEGNNQQDIRYPSEKSTFKNLAR